MKLFKEGAFVDIGINQMLKMGTVIDVRLSVVEAEVAKFYSIDQDEIYAVRDTESKIICCYLLARLFGYDFSSLSTKYRVNIYYLRQQINNINKRILTDNEFSTEINKLQANCINETATASNGVKAG